MTVNLADFVGRFGELTDLVDAGTPVTIEFEGRRVALAAAPPEPTPGGKREWKFDLHAGLIEMRDDFDDYITEEQFLRGDFE